MATVTISPAAPRATIDACMIMVEDAEQNDLADYSTTTYPTSPEVRYYLSFEKGGDELGRSYVFGVSEDGDHEFMDYIFPSSGSWTVHLRLVSDDSSVANDTATVS